MRHLAFLLLACAFAPVRAGPPVPAPEPDPAPADAPIEQVLAHPLFQAPYMCSEHAAGELPYPGDDLGQDCMVTGMEEDASPGFFRLYRTDGLGNEDWYGWNQPVHAPCDCEVVQLHVNPRTNPPGQPHQSRASGVVLKAADGTLFALAHLQGFLVEEGAHVKAGERIGFVGNNGYARAPHVHIGAWRGKQALQVRWDQRAMSAH
ncbi:M23 family metallopeptidase [Marilutibacter spongiae]|uniref:M23 family metallopeptidase n=1 Tax=Marilutibacter spongiae TaxID=2025720 RepID=A0A7W3TPR6_9GAMM|nr:M23 family metallopeptidase [Lysobacter spongiae]MBB1062004.1 M23 family metallopeptidase [Lysobacter spongiae]